MSYYHAQQNPAYHGSYDQKYQDQHLQMPTTTSVVREAPRWSWCSVVWGVIASCCCASWCGMIGLLCSIFSYTDHKAGDYDRASHKRRWSWGCTITGLVLSILAIVAIILVFTVFREQICDNYGLICLNNLNLNING